VCGARSTRHGTPLVREAQPSQKPREGKKIGLGKRKKNIPGLKVGWQEEIRPPGPLCPLVLNPPQTGGENPRGNHGVNPSNEVAEGARGRSQVGKFGKNKKRGINNT